MTNLICDGTDSTLTWIPRDDGTCEIVDIEVANARRRQGVGHSMVNLLIDEMMPKESKLLWAITRSTNKIAQEFYEHMHFRVVGVLRNFYKDEASPTDGVDAIMYGRDVRRDSDGKDVR